MADATGSARAHAKWVLGYQVYYTTYHQRWLRAIGPSVNTFELPRAAPLVGPSGTDPYWATTTVVEGGAGTTEVDVTNTAGVAFRITTAANEFDGANIQASGAAFTLAANKPLYFGAKVAINNATSTDLFVGLCQTRTAFFTAAAHTISASTKSHVGFYKLDAVTATKYVAEKNTVVTSSSAGTMGTSAHIYELNFDGSNMHYFLDGTQVGTIALASCPTANPLRPTISFRNGNAAVRLGDVYWWRVIQLGY